MFQLAQLLKPELTFCAVAGVSKKRAIEDASRLICSEVPTLDENDLYSNLLAREKLGSTALGDGIAIPHCRLSGCEQPIVALMTLADPVDFDASDGQAVDILFLLMVPEEATEEHLELLAGLAGLLNQPGFRRSLREADTARQLHHNAVSYQL
ncbi:MAG: PTS sugar transporter subunit IIA [Halieaceae bacterium]|jgi:PTS system nitrogen regulatory IIA component|nr:PTS sugar transporter subunit IIA [Halieaceae bacterium]